MTREEKVEEIESLKISLASAPNVYLADTSELNAEQTVKLRRACFKSDIKLRVVKNTLLKRAMEASDKEMDKLYDVLKGTTSLMLSERAGAPAKLIKEFRKKLPKPILKGAYVQESVYIGDDQVNPLAAIKSKEEVIGDIIILLQSPAKNVISALQSSKDKLAGIVKTLSEK